MSRALRAELKHSEAKTDLALADAKLADAETKLADAEHKLVAADQAVESLEHKLGSAAAVAAARDIILEQRLPELRAAALQCRELFDARTAIFVALSKSVVAKIEAIDRLAAAVSDADSASASVEQQRQQQQSRKRKRGTRQTQHRVDPAPPLVAEAEHG